MDFEWSEAKRIAVLEARGLDFIDAESCLTAGRSIRSHLPQAQKNDGLAWANWMGGLSPSF